MNNEINSISYFVIESKEPERITQDNYEENKRSLSNDNSVYVDVGVLSWIYRQILL